MSHTYYYRIKELCIKLVIEISLSDEDSRQYFQHWQRFWNCCIQSQGGVLRRGLKFQTCTNNLNIFFNNSGNFWIPPRVSEPTDAHKCMKVCRTHSVPCRTYSIPLISFGHSCGHLQGGATNWSLKICLCRYLIVHCAAMDNWKLNDAQLAKTAYGYKNTKKKHCTSM